MKSNLNIKYFDTHAHLLDDRFDADRAEIAGGLKSQGIAYMLEAAINARDSEDVLGFVREYDFMYAALGTHPHDASKMRHEHMEKLKLALRDEKAVAVGEIGLDYHYDNSPKDKQKYWFDSQLALAGELNLPVVLHVREADADALDILKSHKNKLRGVMHCFSGSYETAKLCLNMGLYIAFGGALTFKSAKKSVEVAARLPLDRLLIETDCPYLTPEPYRKLRNDPSMVSLVCQRLAFIKGITPERCAQATLENGLDLFGIG